MEELLLATRIMQPLNDAQRCFGMAHIPSARRLRLEQTENEKRRDEQLCAWMLLRSAIRRAIGAAELPDVEWLSGGKPRFLECPLSFSLSHTDGAVFCAISGGEVGADMEKIRPMRLNTMRRIANTERVEIFFERWVQMESIGKKRGDGILPALRTPIGEEESVYLIDTFPGYAAAVCVERGRSRGELWVLPQAELFT